MTQTEAQKKAKKKYDKEHMQIYSVKMPKELHNEMMTEVKNKQTNRNAYTIKAIREKLENDKNKNV